MLEIVIIGTLMALCGATKKTTKPVFGQMTLTGEKALDWVRDGVKVTASKIQIGTPQAFSDFNVPEWAAEKGYLALIFPLDPYANPFLVSQKSILKILEAKCCEFEAKGASVETVKLNGSNVAQVTFDENEPTFEFLRPENAKQYDPYKVIVE